eukprot:2405632-Pyramimonas_sp.AAC.1
MQEYRPIKYPRPRRRVCPPGVWLPKLKKARATASTEASSAASPTPSRTPSGPTSSPTPSAPSGSSTPIPS